MVRLLGAALATTLLLAACGETMMANDKQSDATGKDSAATEIPADAIAVGEDVYMVPVGTDDGGCQMYRVFSPDKATVQAIHYRTADGRFVMDKEEACER